LALMAAVGCLLLIGCLNLGVLLIARASGRAREMAVRAALGASGGRLRVQMLAEVVPLSIAGAVAGVLFASFLLAALGPLFPAGMPRVDELGLHGPVLVFAIAASVVVVVAAALLPSRMAARADLAATLQRDSRGVAGGGMARSVLVVAQIAVTVVLLFA